MLAGFVLDRVQSVGLGERRHQEQVQVRLGVTERWPFTNIPKLRLGMWIFLASDIIVFGAIIASDLYLRVNSPVAVADSRAASTTSPLGLFLTIVLLTSGLTAVLALERGQAGQEHAG